MIPSCDGALPLAVARKGAVLGSASMAFIVLMGVGVFRLYLTGESLLLGFAQTLGGGLIAFGVALLVAYVASEVEA